MYVVFEGIDGVGKSTQIELLKAVYPQAIFSYEPGATQLGKYLREILLEKNHQFSKRAEILLFLADRAEHYEEILSTNSDRLIISDRSFISGIAYANKIFDFDTLFALNSLALNGFFPQKCVFLKADENLLQERFAAKGLDKIEQRGTKYFLEVQNELEKCLEILSEKINMQVLTLDARQNIAKLHERIKEFIND